MGDIDIKGTDLYVGQTRAALDSIEKTPVGQVIVSRIRSSSRDLTIVPYTDGGCDSTTRSLNQRGGAPEGVSDRGPALWYVGNLDITTRNDSRYDLMPARATGEGSNVRIFYSPEIWSPTGCFKGQYGAMADETLFHELVHCLRYMQGKSNPIPTGDRFTGYGNEEEFLAVVVTNVYMSAKGSTDLREDHTGHNLLKPPLNTSAGFLTDKDNLKMLSIYRLIWTDVFNALAVYGMGVFNPFRELNARLAYLGHSSATYSITAD